MPHSLQGLLPAVLISILFVGHVGHVGSADADDADIVRNGRIISEFLEDGWESMQITPAEDCIDQVFVRRLYLDVAGRIPTVAERDAFLQDARPERRHHLVMSLTQSEDYVQHFADMFDTLLMGRGSSEKYRQRASSHWRAWLERVFRQNRPWNDVVGQILLARPDDTADRGVTWFLYERNNKHQEIAEAIAPAFFGIRIECAQCHDHMVATEIEQRHYWGLVAFFNRGKNVGTENGPRVGESAIGGFSEFAGLDGESHPNFLTFFRSKTVEETRPQKGEKQEESDGLYVPALLQGDPRIPKFSRRERFVSDIVSEHPLIARAFVNRVWAMLIGRGLVHPFDEMDSAHPPSLPELLDWLAEDFRRSGYNIRRLVQSVLHARTYHLSSRRSEDHHDASSFAWYLERPLTAEQFGRSAQLAVHGDTQIDQPLVDAIRIKLPDVLPDEMVTGVGEALFLTNNEQWNRFLTDTGDARHLVHRTAALPDHRQRASLLVQSLFGREPDRHEVAAIAGFLGTDRDHLNHRLTQVVWSLMTSAEFRLNH